MELPACIIEITSDSVLPVHRQSSPSANTGPGSDRSFLSGREKIFELLQKFAVFPIITQSILLLHLLKHGARMIDFAGIRFFVSGRYIRLRRRSNQEVLRVGKSARPFDLPVVGQ